MQMYKYSARLFMSFSIYRRFFSFSVFLLCLLFIILLFTFIEFEFLIIFIIANIFQHLFVYRRRSECVPFAPTVR